MSRYVLKEAQGPKEIKIGNESKWFCQCGLTTNPPYCSGMHKKTLGEEPNKIYFYEKDGTRREVQKL